MDVRIHPGVEVASDAVIYGVARWLTCSSQLSPNTVANWLDRASFSWVTLTRKIRTIPTTAPARRWVQRLHWALGATLVTHDSYVPQYQGDLFGDGARLCGSGVDCQSPCIPAA
jgi:hypothetical protein